MPYDINVNRVRFFTRKNIEDVFKVNKIGGVSVLVPENNKLVIRVQKVKWWQFLKKRKIEKVIKQIRYELPVIIAFDWGWVE